MLRADRLLKTADGKYIIIDWKSCRETSLRAQSYVGIKKGYDIQAALYVKGVAQHFGVPESDVCFIAILQCKDEPIIIRQFTFTPETLAQANEQINNLVPQFWDCVKKYESVGEDAFFEPDTDIHSFAHIPNFGTQDEKEEMKIMKED